MNSIGMFDTKGYDHLPYEKPPGLPGSKMRRKQRKLDRVNRKKGRKR